MRRHWLKLVFISVLALFLVGLVGFSFKLTRLFYLPMAVETHTDSLIQLDKSTSAASFVRTLKSREMIQSDRLFLNLIRIQGLSHQLKAGIYRVKKGESAAQFLSRVIAGDVLKESFSIIEGTTQRQISTELKIAPYLTYQANDWLSISSGNPEGLLLADTYQYNAGSQGRDLLIRAHTNLKKYLEWSWQERAPNLPYKTSYDLLIVASIIEKESANTNEKRLIAGVVVNRLRKYMPLQMDPTVIYGLGTDYTGKLSHDNLQIDSPYNTYRYRGLPPTPIAMVGKDAIDAAAHPKLTNYLYFVARGDGTHCFSATYDEQKRAIARYLKVKK